MDTKWAFINEHIDRNNENDSDIFALFKRQAELGARFAELYPEYYKLSLNLRKEKGNGIYDTAVDYLGGDSDNILEELICRAIEKGDFNSGLPADFIVKTLGYLFMHFDDIFHTAEDTSIEKMLFNLDLYVDFMKHGMGKQK